MPYTNEGVPYVNADTSEAAAEQYADTKAGDLAKVLVCIKHSNYGLTCDEVEVILQMRHQTASARIRDLVLNGSIIDTGMRKRTRSGRSARIYHVIL